MIAAARDYQAEISPDHQIRMDIAALPPAISADGKLLKHAFQNLLSNAVKYSLNSPEIVVKGWTEGDFALISIKDHGVGIIKDAFVLGPTIQNELNIDVWNVPQALFH